MKIISSFILLTLISFSAYAQKKADLTYHLELNKVYRVKSITTQNTTQTVMGNEQAIQTNNTSVISLKPLKQLEEEMMVQVSFDTIHTIISQPPMDINSALPGDLNSTDPIKVMGCIMNRMANSTFLVKMTNTGRVVQFMNLEPTVSGILQGIDSIQGQAAPFLRERAGMMVEEKALASMIESVTAHLPGSEVKIGEQWEMNLRISGGGMVMSQYGNYKLESLDKKTATISGDLVVESEPGTIEMNGAQITPDIRGLGKSELAIDTGTGWLIKGTIKQQLKGEMAVSAQGNNMTIPIEINSTSELVALP
jgi:hypothetical protein